MSKMEADVSVLEVFRCRQKDQLYIPQFQHLIIKLANAVAGAKVVASKRALINRWSQLLYHLLLSAPHGKTIGEEEMGILQVEISGKPLGLFKRLIASVIISFGDILLADCVADLKKAKVPGTKRMLPIIQFFSEAIQSTRSGSFSLDSLFFLEFFHWLIKLKYVRYGNNKRRSATFGLSKAFTFIIFASFACKVIGRFITPNTTIGQREEICENTNSSSSLAGDIVPCGQCSLCRDVYRDATLAPCGHVFCWICSHHWFGRHKNCPECRAEANSSSLLLLRNFH